MSTKDRGEESTHCSSAIGFTYLASESFNLSLVQKSTMDSLVENERKRQGEVEHCETLGAESKW